MVGTFLVLAMEEAGNRELAGLWVHLGRCPNLGREKYTGERKKKFISLAFGTKGNQQQRQNIFSLKLTV